MDFELLFLLAALLVALALRPWRQLRNTALATPVLAVLVLLPWLWAMPRMHSMPIPLQWSGACLVMLMVGWPLAVPLLCAVAALSALWVDAPQEVLVQQAFWQGVLPATLALGWGDGFMTGLLTAIFVAYAPQWLATWSDQRYLGPRRHP